MKNLTVSYQNMLNFAILFNINPTYEINSFHISEYIGGGG